MKYKNHATLTIKNLLPLELFALKQKLTEDLGTRVRIIEEQPGELNITLWRGEPLPDGGVCDPAEIYKKKNNTGTTS